MILARAIAGETRKCESSRWPGQSFLEDLKAKLRGKVVEANLT